MSTPFLEELPYAYLLRLRRAINNEYVSSVYGESVRFYLLKLHCPFIGIPMTVGDPANSHLILCRGGKCLLWDTTLNECGIILQEQQRTHTHRQHWHVFGHLCNEGYLDASCGKEIGSYKDQSKAAFLLAEFMGNEDVDNDGQIYGKDFKIDPDDSGIPSMLKSIMNHPLLTATVTMTWQEYLDSV